MPNLNDRNPYTKHVPLNNAEIFSNPNLPNIAQEVNPQGTPLWVFNAQTQQPAQQALQNYQVQPQPQYNSDVRFQPNPQQQAPFQQFQQYTIGQQPPQAYSIPQYNVPPFAQPPPVVNRPAIPMFTQNPYLPPQPLSQNQSHQNLSPAVLGYRSPREVSNTPHTAHQPAMSSATNQFQELRAPLVPQRHQAHADPLKGHYLIRSQTHGMLPNPTPETSKPIETQEQVQSTQPQFNGANPQALPNSYILNSRRDTVPSTAPIKEFQRYFTQEPQARPSSQIVSPAPEPTVVPAQQQRTFSNSPLKDKLDFRPKYDFRSPQIGFPQRQFNAEQNPPPTMVPQQDPQSAQKPTLIRQPMAQPHFVTTQNQRHNTPVVVDRLKPPVMPSHSIGSQQAPPNQTLYPLETFRNVGDAIRFPDPLQLQPKYMSPLPLRPSSLTGDNGPDAISPPQDPVRRIIIPSSMNQLKYHKENGVTGRTSVEAANTAYSSAQFHPHIFTQDPSVQPVLTPRSPSIQAGSLSIRSGEQRINREVQSEYTKPSKPSHLPFHDTVTPAEAQGFRVPIRRDVSFPLLPSASEHLNKFSSPQVTFLCPKPLANQHHGMLRYTVPDKSRIWGMDQKRDRALTSKNSDVQVSSVQALFNSYLLETKDRQNEQMIQPSPERKRERHARIFQD